MANAEPTQQHPAMTGTAPAPRRARRRLIAAAAALLVAAGADGTVLWASQDHGTPTAATDQPVKAQTVAVERAELSDTQEKGGTLGYGTEKPVKAAKRGVVTWLPEPGKAIKRGRALYRVDDRPVPVFYGAIPLYRKLDKPGMTGSDVKVVADNLRALGYDFDGVPGGSTERTSVAGSGPDQGRFTESLKAAVQRWQKLVGMKPTGVLDVGDVVVLPGPVRVGAVKAQLGDEAGDVVAARVGKARPC